MSTAINPVQVIEIGTEVEHTPLQYIYATIPAEYICVYHRILIMLADYGIDMLKDCKATCKDRNSGVIECFNMFNSAVAAYQLAKGSTDSKYYKLATTLIKYIKTKINQIYGGKDNSTSFVFPVDDNGQLKAFVSCGELPKFRISAEDGDLYEHKFHNGFDEHFRLGPEDTSIDGSPSVPRVVPRPGIEYPFTCVVIGSYETQQNKVVPCADIVVRFNGRTIDLNKTDYELYFDGDPVVRFNDVHNVINGNHEFMCVVNYNGRTAIGTDICYYEA